LRTVAQLPRARGAGGALDQLATPADRLLIMRNHDPAGT
jgi:hypothetical protein